MNAGVEGYSPDRSPVPNPVHESLLDKRAFEIQLSRFRVADVVFVYDYDHVNQTVDVVLATDSRSKPIRGVPIAGTGGHGVRNIRAWKGLLQTDKPDIGVIVYPKLGGGRRFLDFIRRDSSPLHVRIEQTAIFFGGMPAAISAGEVMPLNIVQDNPLLHQIGKNDNGMVAPSGAGFMVKENDDIVIRGNRIFVLGMSQTQADAQAVARQGDAGDGTGGAIAGGSTKVFSG